MMNATRTRISNWRNRRTLARGRRPRITQAADQVRSRTPLYRDRVNRATGRPHRNDARLGRTADHSLAQVKTTREAAPPWARARGRQRDLGFWSAYEQGSRAVLESRLPRPPRQGRGPR